MIPRYQRIAFWTLCACIVLMTLFLLRGCEQAHKRLTAGEDETPIAAPTNTSTEDVALYLASDADGSIAAATRSIPLPQEPTLRARALLDHLLAEYANPASPHHLQGGSAVTDVFLLPLPNTATPEFSPAATQLAVVNLSNAFVANHPSGIEVEELTVQSIIGTLHAAFPQLMQIRFLVDGQPHDTLAGHADLQHIYPAVDTSHQPAPLAVEQNAPVVEKPKIQRAPTPAKPTTGSPAKAHPVKVPAAPGIPQTGPKPARPAPPGTPQDKHP
ncbi:MAG: Lipoprotein LpqB, GerMN domain protein [Acidobacteriaceae bacterium]|nr:Lipoprotein LpqB, GerMN domain protein [Acidobacteriaceae bacterium]